MIGTFGAEWPGMRTFEQDNYTTYCGADTEWDKLKSRCSKDEKVSVMDLRTAGAAARVELADMPDGWLYRRMPVQASTVSEQDIDVFRREQRRSGKMLVVGSTECTGALLALTDISRLKRSLLPEGEISELGPLEEDEANLKDWLNRYLERHATTETLGEW